MKYTGPKFKLARREGVNLFGVPKYDIRKRRKLPGQHWGTMPRLSEYWKLLRNKQLLKRSYLMSEKQFRTLIMQKAWKFAKNKDVAFDEAVKIFLERRLDVTLVRAGLAKTIMQARQMVGHGHVLLNWRKHNIPSYLIKKGDVVEVREKLKTSPLYAQAPILTSNFKPVSWLNVDKQKLTIEIIDLPKSEEIKLPADVLKVIEFYAR